VEEADKNAFVEAWLRPESLRELLKLARRASGIFGEEPDELLQRVFLQILKSERTFRPGDNVLRLAERTLRGMVANRKRKKENEAMGDMPEGQTVDDAPSSQGNPERARVHKEREEAKARIFAEAEKDLPEGEVGKRARRLLDCVRRGMDDPEDIARELGITESQVKKARAELAESLRRVAKRMGKDVEALRGEP
jgi:RNA polymerase sigma factor (sigma-70 family)